MRFLSRLFRPLHTAESVAHELIEGLRNGSITLGEPTAEDKGENVIVNEAESEVIEVRDSDKNVAQFERTVNPSISEQTPLL